MRRGRAEVAKATPAVPEPEADDDAARSLEDQVERFQSVFEDAAIGMATMTLQGSIVRANNALSRMLGRARASFSGRRTAQAVDDDPGVAGAIRRSSRRARTW